MHSFNVLGNTYDGEIQKSKKKFSAMSIKTMYGHTKRTNHLAWNITGDKLASASDDEVIRIWSNVDRKTSSNADSLQLKGHTGSVYQVCWNPTNPDILASTSSDKSIRFWDARIGQCTTNIETKYEGGKIIWNPDGNYLICAGKTDNNNNNNNIDVALAVDPKINKVRRISKFRYPINELSFNTDGSIFYVVTLSGDIEMWETKDWIPKLVQVLNTTSTSCCVDVAPNGKTFITGGLDSLVSIWDTNEQVCLRTLDHLGGSIKNISISHDSVYVASGNEDTTTSTSSTIDISHIETGENVWSIPNSAVTSLAWHPSKHILAYSFKEINRHDRDVGTIKVIGALV
jgi:THO complex subunit 3